ADEPFLAHLGKTSMKSIAANGPVAPPRHGVALGVLRSNDQIKFRRRLDRGRHPSITNRNRRTFGDEWRDGSCWKLLGFAAQLAVDKLNSDRHNPSFLRVSR